MDHLWTFPTIVSTGMFPDHQVHNPRWAERIRTLVPTAGKRQTGDTLHEDPHFQLLVEFIVGRVAERFEYFRYTQRNFFITSCWANLHGRGDGLSTHRHPNSFLSGVYYVAVPEGASLLILRDPRPANIMFDIERSEHTPWNRPEFLVRPSAGGLLLFPSWLEHDVQSSDIDAERISISFNVMVRGELGSSRHLTRLRL